MKYLLPLLFLLIGFYACSGSNSTEENGGWTELVINEQIEGCLRKAKQSFERNPEYTKRLCTCTVDKTKAKMSFKESMALLKKSREEQNSVVKPIIESCISDLQGEF